MGARTRRIATATIGTKASSLATARVGRAAWCRPSPRTRGLGINHLAFAASFVAGYFGSMLGLVLGTLRLPFVILATGSPLAAAGTNIAISAAAAGAGGLRHAREGRVDWRVVAWTAQPSVVGAVAGALIADDVSEALLFRADRCRPRLERNRPRATSDCGTTA